VAGTDRRRLLAALAAGGAALLGPGRLAARTAGPAAAHGGDLGAALAAMVAAGELPHALATVRRHGRAVAEARVGWSDIARRAPIRPDALFRLHSMTKAVTSVAALMLVEDGRLRLADPLPRYLPALDRLAVYAGDEGAAMKTVPAERPITLTDLLTHTAGFTYEFMGDTPVHRHYRAHGISSGLARLIGMPEAAPPPQSLDALITRLGQAPLLHQPGARFSYGFSTTVLGAVIEQVTGERLGAFFQSRIFDPLGLADTGFAIDEARLPRLVTCYLRTAAGLLPGDPQAAAYRNPAFDDGGGGLLGTIADYGRFAELLAGRGAWRGRRLLQAATVDAMFRPLLRTGGVPEEDSPFGLGLAIGDAGTEARGGVPRGAGSWAGTANTYFLADPGRGTTAVLMTNVLTPPPYQDQTWRLRALVNRAARAA
jgi:CubicO group peptidase (beta-lactamase class C family)